MDVYGRCGNLTCSRNYAQEDRDCLSMISKTYKYYLSFENALCKDYVTEKLYNILPLDMVPIVRGGANYSRFVPEKWYINTADFSSPKQLAEHLYSIDKKPEIYLQYFKHRNKYTGKGYFGVKNLKSWCSLCENLNSPHKKHNVYKDIAQWWSEKDCHNPTVV